MICLTSDDGGATWSRKDVTVSGPNLDGRDETVGLTEIVKGNGTNLIAVFETNTNAGPLGIYALTSADGGVTWKNKLQVLPEAGPVVKRKG